MGRWPAGAQDRLQRAAIDLFAEHGYDRTTVADIAGRAGLTERTYYNHFATKAEVLFPGQEQFNAGLAEAVRAAPSGQGPLDVVVAALLDTTGWFDERLEPGRRRRRILDAHPELLEREVAKMAALGTALTDALRDRGCPESDAVLTATVAVAVYQLASTGWLADPRDRSLGEHLRAAVADLRATASRWGADAGSSPT